MENNYSNYDMLDKMVANNKKAKSWTAFWVIILCLMAVAVLWLANTVSEKNKAIIIKDQNLELKSRIIDSLTKNCNEAKTEIIKDYDSVITQTQVALDIVTNESNSGSGTNLSPDQKEKIKEANTTIERIQKDLKNVKAEIKKVNPRLFIQYNNPKEADLVEKMLYSLKKESNYIVAPPEYINNSFPTVIKFYNYKNEREERFLTKLIASYFNISPQDIQVKYDENAKIKSTIEIWIDSRQREQKLMQIQLPKKN